MAVPNIFGTATAAIPLSQLDQNFATAITLGNTAVYLGNTTTSLGNVTLTNVTISSGTSNIAANVSTAVGLLPEAQGGTGTTTGYYGFKNRIINGAMVIDQRNAGASVTVNTGTNVFSVDRWAGAGTGSGTDGAFTMQQDLSAPTGFSNSIKVTVTTIDAVMTGSQSYQVTQSIEGFNTSDLSFGTASAKAITLSFWARSSLTGTFGGALSNSAFNRSYPFTYTISVADTWEYKTVTIAGDTSGTWIGSTNGIGLRVYFGLGAGSDRAGTAGAWAGAGHTSATGAVSVIGTLSATWYITGVQLEKGSTATSFDYRPYTTELQLAQRYYYKNFPAIVDKVFNVGYAGSTTSARLVSHFPVVMRTVPSALEQTGTATDYSVYIAAGEVNCSSVPTYSSFTTTDTAFVNFTTSGSMTGGGGVVGITNTTTAYLAWSAEL
jgi:hypothetical protein